MFALTAAKAKSKPEAMPSIGRLAGALCLSHGMMLAVWFATQGQIERILSVAHMPLIVAGLALLVRSRWLTCTAFVAAGPIHALWLTDLAAVTFFKAPLVGVAQLPPFAFDYSWLAVAHFLYLLPGLFFILAARKWYHPLCFFSAAAMFMYLTILSRAMADPAMNLNFAFSLPAFTQNATVANGIVQVNQLPAVFYVTLANLLMAAFGFAPFWFVASMFRNRSKKERK